MNVLVTGAEGFCGSHLLRYLQRCKDEHDLTIVAHVKSADREADVCALADKVTHGDLSSRDLVGALLETALPGAIFHLAATTGASGAEADLRDAASKNLACDSAVLAAAAALRPQPRVLVTSSGAVYGEASSRKLAEDSPIAPRTHYGLGKEMLEITARFYARRFGLHTIIVRPFNVVGPDQKDNRVVGRIAHQVAGVLENDMPPVIQLRGTQTFRDFIDVRDTVCAYFLLLNQGDRGTVYNVCSGTATSIEGIVRLYSDITGRDIRVTTVDVPHSDHDVQYQCGDASRLSVATGWSAGIPLRQSLDDMLQHCRAALGDVRR